MKISGPVIFPPTVATVTDDGRIRRADHPPLIEEPQSGQSRSITAITIITLLGADTSILDRRQSPEADLSHLSGAAETGLRAKKH